MKRKCLKKWVQKQSPARLLVFGFASVIFTGTLLLMLPFSHHAGYPVTFIDAFFIATSAVCVTGLTTVPVGFTFTPFGYTVIAVLIQIGGLGVATMGVLFTLIIGKKIGLKTRQLVVESMNLSGYGKLIYIMKIFLKITFVIETVGAVLSFFVFIKDYNFLTAVGYAIFHSISAFNNAGFDILGGYDSLLHYAANVPLNLITTGLVILGGFGFYAIWEFISNRFQWKKFSLNTKIVTIMTLFLLVAGTFLLKLTTSQTWLEAWFQSTISRTAGFNTHPLSQFTPAALLIFVILMFIGANPGSTGGGIKTTTCFMVAFHAISSTMQDNRDEIFHRRIPSIVFKEAFTVLFFGLAVVLIGTICLLAFEPTVSMAEALVEVTSAFGTVGSSLGITPTLGTPSKIVLIICMFIGRVGPVTIATLWVAKKHSHSHYTEENVMIG